MEKIFLDDGMGELWEVLLPGYLHLGAAMILLFWVDNDTFGGRHG